MLPPARPLADLPPPTYREGSDFSVPESTGTLYVWPTGDVARERGHNRLRDSAGGQELAAADPETVPYSDWKNASADYARVLSGDVHVYVPPAAEGRRTPRQRTTDDAAFRHGGIERDSILSQVELPELMRNPAVTSVTFHHLPPPGLEPSAQQQQPAPSPESSSLGDVATQRQHGQLAPDVREAIQALRTSDGNVDQAALTRLLDQLPELPSTDREPLRELTARALGVPAETLTLRNVAEGSNAANAQTGNSGATVWLVRDESGRVVAVTKDYIHPTKPEWSRTELGKELSALEFLESQDFPTLRAVRIEGVAKAGSAGVLVMSVAPGRAMDQVLRDVTGAPDNKSRNEAFVAAREAVIANGRAMAELHSVPQGSGTQRPTAASIETAVLQPARAKSEQIALALEQRPIDGLSPQLVRERAAQIIADYQADPGPNSAWHGAYHPGNVFYDPAEGISLIDTAHLTSSLGDNQLPIGSPAHDATFFEVKLATYGHRYGMTPVEIHELQRAFRASYEEAYRRDGAEIPESARRFYEWQIATASYKNVLYPKKFEPSPAQLAAQTEVYRRALGLPAGATPDRVPQDRDGSLGRAPRTVQHDGAPWDVVGVTAIGQLELRRPGVTDRHVPMQLLAGRTVQRGAATFTVSSVDRKGLTLRDADHQTQVVAWADASELTFAFSTRGNRYRLDGLQLDVVRLSPADADAKVVVPLDAVGGPVQVRLAGRELEGLFEVRRGEDGTLQATPVGVADAAPIAVTPEQLQRRYVDVYSPEFERTFEADAFRYRRDALRSSPIEGETAQGRVISDPRIGQLPAGTEVKVLGQGEQLRELAERLRDPALRGPLDITNRNFNDRGVAAELVDAILEYKVRNPDSKVRIIVSRPLDEAVVAKLHEGKVEVVMLPSRGTSPIVVHTKSAYTPEGGRLSTATFTGDSAKKYDASVELPPAVSATYQRYLEVIADPHGDPQERKALHDELAAAGVPINDPVLDSPYVARTIRSLVANATTELVIDVTDVRSPEMAQRLVDKAAQGVRVELGTRELDPRSAEILQEGARRYPTTLRLHDTSKLSPYPHGNIIIADGVESYVGTAFLWDNQLGNLQPTGKSIEDGAVLGADASEQLRHDLQARRGLPLDEAKVAQLRGPEGELDRAAVRQLIETLPDLGDASVEKLRDFAAGRLSLPADSLIVKPIAEAKTTGHLGVSGSPVYFVLGADGTLKAVVKILKNQDEFGKELSAASWLTDQRFEHSGTPGVLGAARTGDRGILMTEVAKGDSLDALMVDTARTTDPQERAQQLATLRDATRATARALAELHTKPARSGEGVARGRLIDKWVSTASAKAIADYTQEQPVPGLDAPVLDAQMQGAAQQMGQQPGPGTVTHGDFHPGNIFYDPEQGVTFIDTGAIAESLDPAGAPLGSPARDLANFDNRVDVRGQKHGLTREETQELRRIFLDEYTAAGGYAENPAAIQFFKRRAAVAVYVIDVIQEKGGALTPAQRDVYLRSLLETFELSPVEATPGSQETPAPADAPVTEETSFIDALTHSRDFEPAPERAAPGTDDQATPSMPPPSQHAEGVAAEVTARQDERLLAIARRLNPDDPHEVIRLAVLAESLASQPRLDSAEDAIEAALERLRRAERSSDRSWGIGGSLKMFRVLLSDPRDEEGRDDERNQRGNPPGGPS